MIPLQIFYLSSLAVYAFFIFFAFFVYKRSVGRLSGKLAAAALLALAIYVGSAVLIYDTKTPGSHLMAWGAGWIGGCLGVALWVHMITVLEREKGNKGSTLSGSQRIGITASYIAAVTLAVAGSFAPPTSNWLFDMRTYGPAPWPYCQWTPFWSGTGPYYPAFGLYVLACLGYTTSRLGYMAYRAHKSVETAATSFEAGTSLASRNEYLWLLTATSMLAWSAIFLTVMVALGVKMPESIGHVFLAAGGLIIGLVISRHDALVAERDVAPDFYKAAASAFVVSASVVAALYLGEHGQVSKTTLLVLVTATILFFVNIDSWWRLMDRIFLGPQVASERARVRHVLEDSAPDPELLRLKTVFSTWSEETKRVFLLLGKGMSRRNAATKMNYHLSSVDLHIRRLKDDLGTDRLEEVRSLAHKLLIHQRISESIRERAEL